MAAVVGHHQIFLSLLQANHHLILQSAVIDIFRSRPAHHIQLTRVVLGLYELVQVLADTGSVGELSHFDGVSILFFARPVEFVDPGGGQDQEPIEIVARPPGVDRQHIDHHLPQICRDQFFLGGVVENLHEA